MGPVNDNDNGNVSAKPAGLVDRFLKFREQNIADRKAANKPNMMGVRPQDQSYKQRSLGQVATAFVDGRRQSIAANRPVPIQKRAMEETNPLVREKLNPTPLPKGVSPAPIQQIANPYPENTPPKLQEQAKKFQGQGYQFNTPDTGAPIPGTSAMYKDIVDPTGNDNRTRAVIPGKGTAEIQRTNTIAPTGSALVDASNQARASGRTMGGFVGAATDAEAARNLQSRMEQDQAAQYMVDSRNRGADAERDARAAKLGVSRAVLDQMEGRNDSPAVQAMRQRQAANAPYEAMDKAQSAYRNEMAAIAKMRENAPRGRPGDRVRREAVYKEADARAAAAENLLNSSLGIAGKRLDAESNRQANAVAAETARLQEAGTDRRARMQNDTTLEAARLNQAGGLAREEMQQMFTDQRSSAKNMEDSFKAGADYLAQATSPNGKNPPIVNIDKLIRFRDGLDYAKLAELTSPETARRIKSGQLHPDEAQRLVGMAAQWDEDPSSLWNLFTAKAKTPSYTNAQPSE